MLLGVDCVVDGTSELERGAVVDEELLAELEAALEVGLLLIGL